MREPEVFTFATHVTLDEQKYWVGQKVRSGFSVPSHGEMQMKFLSNSKFNLGICIS